MALVSPMTYTTVKQVAQATALHHSGEIPCGTGSFSKANVAASAPASASVSPLARYNGKLMNSIWGLYNMYASHTFQKNIEPACNGTHDWNDPEWLQAENDS
ncbi:hypothetical protein BIW11_04689 [Tropilaelaps mercedesae]|uniref:Uncharacterized protein n=1 Tax=Tropilaelaps mercedesae TaxID=418985 RepID=A0A1V9X2U8_9ACAR|nr:hypothetical protein BIW11_04689 [Tropilaelaps mercedesae]